MVTEIGVPRKKFRVPRGQDEAPSPFGFMGIWTERKGHLRLDPLVDLVKTKKPLQVSESLEQDSGKWKWMALKLVWRFPDPETDVVPS